MVTATPTPCRAETSDPPSRRVRTVDAAEYVGLTPSTLEKLRHFGGGPEYFKVGRLCIYDTRALDAWLNQRRRTSTSDSGEAA